jgi:two-component system, NarL family, response regulator DesR
MIRTIVIADTGAAMARVTDSLNEAGNVELVRYAGGRCHVDALVRAHRPDLVIIAEVRRPCLALARIAEARRAAPGCAVIVLAAWSKAGWLAEALRVGAAAVLPADVSARTLHLVIGEVLDAPEPEVATVHELRPHAPKVISGSPLGSAITEGSAA